MAFRPQPNEKCREIGLFEVLSATDYGHENVENTRGLGWIRGDVARITPKDVKDKGHVPTNGSVFFSIFQSFMSGPENKPYFGQYPADFFDLVIVDECHRGGAKDESRWRGIMEYFS